MTAKEAKEIRDLVVNAIHSHDFKSLYENRHTIKVYLNNMVTMAESGDREKAILAEITRLIPIRSHELADALVALEATILDVLTGNEKSPAQEQKDPSEPCCRSCGEGCGSFQDCQRPCEDPTDLDSDRIRSTGRWENGEWVEEW